MPLLSPAISGKAKHWRIQCRINQVVPLPKGQFPAFQIGNQFSISINKGAVDCVRDKPLVAE
jgi:hypothetical protein